MLLNFIIILLATISNVCNGANILGIVVTPSYSHQLAYMNLWKELSLKGHKVTVLTTNPQNNSSLVNLTEIDLSIGYKCLQQKIDLVPKNVVEFQRFTCSFSIEVDVLYFNLPQVQELINNKHLHFDVVMAETFKPEFLVFGERFKAPTILLTSFEDSFVIHKALQNDYHSILYPDLTALYAGELNFVQRLANFITHWRIAYIQKQCFVQRKNTLDKYFNNVSLTIEEMINKASMLFVAVSPVLLYPRPVSMRTVNIGGGITIKPSQALEKDIQSFLDSAKLGAIYFSLGSNVKSETLGHKTIEAIIEILKNLPYSILWKFNNNGSFVMPENIMTAPWWPQQDVLRHPNVKLFITQGGIQSLEEAIYFEKPLIGIPMIADQESNLKKMELRGILKYVASSPRIDPGELRDAILDVMGNKKYVQNIRRLNKVNLDQPMSGLEKAVWWTEYVVRHKGNVEYMVHKTIPFYQYYFLDIAAVLGLILLSCLGIIYWLIVAIRQLLLSDKRTIVKKML
ncbi:unnamed protein product [Ceutorhynchus assimilis]|uniref:UDP-glucuronosyltransferase n=1 Tax=Ceutorhynchus assimilis TaxID=467358 RepID=A0A9N9ME26_9CUCU|nr:unnamed protein product [Ceutorhynchus assimilis]